MRLTTAKSHQRRGKQFEPDLARWLREQGLDAERIALAGSKDEGDIVVRTKNGKRFVIEAKAPGADGRIDLSGWLKEAEVEAANYAAARNIPASDVLPLLVIKARGKGIDQAYAVQRIGEALK